MANTFILYYPDLEAYNQWQQTNNPINESEEEGKISVEGFRPIHTGSTNQYWGGLCRTTNCTRCFGLLNGTPSKTGNGHAYYAIGQLNGIIWGPKSNYKNIPSGYSPVYLWLKMPQSQITKCQQRSYNRNEIFVIFLLCS